MTVIGLSTRPLWLLYLVAFYPLDGSRPAHLEGRPVAPSPFGYSICD